MRSLLERANRFLDMPLGLGPRALLVARGRCCSSPCYLFPLWNLTMFAPQYPDGLRLDIYSYKLEGGNSGQDVKEINVLNHYIGMKDLVDRGLHRVQVDAVRGRRARPAVPARAVHGQDGARSSTSSCSTSTSACSPSGRSPTSCTGTATTSRRRRRSRSPPFMPPIFGYKKIANFEVVLVSRRRLVRAGACRARCCSPRSASRGAAAAASRRPARLRPCCPSRSLLLALRRRRRSTPSAPGALEGRPPPRDASPLQARVDAARARRHARRRPRRRTAGDLVIDRPLRLVGQRPAAARRLGHRQRRARSAPPTSRSRGSTSTAAAAATSAATPRASTSPRRAPTIRDCRIVDTLFGIYLREADGSAVERLPHPRHPGQGPGREGLRHPRLEHRGLRLDGNEIVDVRDGFYIQSSSHGTIAAQRRARPALRPALHVLRRQRLRGQPLRERRRRHRAHVLEAHHRSAATGSSTTAGSRRSACCSRRATTCSPRTT